MSNKPETRKAKAGSTLTGSMPTAVAVALLMAVAAMAMTPAQSQGAQAPQENAAQAEFPEPAAFPNVPFPDFNWRAERGSPVEARHINELQDASQHLLSRILLDTSGATGCTYAVSLYILFVMDYVQNETGETERDQRLWRHRIAQEDRIRCECGYAPEEATICQGQ